MKLCSINFIILPGLFVLSRLTMCEAAKFDPVYAVTAGSDQFALDLYMEEKILNDKPNMIMSPMGAQIALAVVASGAKGKTFNELIKVLHFPRELPTILHGYSGLWATLKAPELKVANSIFVDQRVDLVPEFSTNMVKYFSSAIQKLPFELNPEVAAKTINSWAEKETNGKIKHLLRKKEVMGASIVLANAIHFKANWKVKFDKDDTKDAKFFTPETIHDGVRMMTMTRVLRYGYIRDLNSKILELPYENDQFRMVFVLPDDIEGLPETESRLHGLGIAKAMQYLKENEVEVKLPKFKIESDLNLKDALSQLGLKTLFRGDCDLTGITKGGVYVSTVKQKAFIEIDEVGTEAAAVTEVTGMGSGWNNPLLIDMPQRFHANHPFLFMIMTDNDPNFSSPNTLFIGKKNVSVDAAVLPKTISPGPIVLAVLVIEVVSERFCVGIIF